MFFLKGDQVKHKPTQRIGFVLNSQASNLLVTFGGEIPQPFKQHDPDLVLVKSDCF
jgi:hypothetical protein